MSDQAERGREGQEAVERDEVPPRVGRLLVIGGAEDPEEGNWKILPHFVEMCGGADARIVVCSSPSGKPEEVADTYETIFNKLGVTEVFEAPIRDRHEAEAPELIEATQRATGIFFTGGDQLRLTALISGTSFCETIRERVFGDGLVVGGTSAGAAALSSVMIIGGRQDGTVRREDVSLAPGLGYWRDTVIDTHFNQRGRVSRLMAIFAHNPNVIGIGIDENTAVDLVPGDRFTVVGAGAVMVFNGRVSHSSAPDASDDETLAITDAVIHTLPAGYGFDLRTKRPLMPDGETIKAIGPS
ncbi:MAG TPA: cyanophycinase [Longimicrobium sp.]|uniref:cyanophycinase n=1 Tax=Longimicrobium sp. TaxID=2029185 RepID=UPI002ED8CAB2